MCILIIKTQKNNILVTLIEHSIKRKHFQWQKTGSDRFFNVLLENYSVENSSWGEGVWVARRLLIIITGFDILHSYDF